MIVTDDGTAISVEEKDDRSAGPVRRGSFGEAHRRLTCPLPENSSINI